MLRTFRSLINRITVIRDPIVRKLVCILLLQVTPFARISDGTIYHQERMEGKVRELRHADHFMTNLNSMMYNMEYGKSLPTECFYPGFRSFE